MTVSASALVSVDTQASQDDLWTPPAVFLPDWAQGVKLSTGWTTNIATLGNAADVRTAPSAKPSRSIQFTVQAMGVSEVALLRSWLGRCAMARTPVPLYCDQTTLTAAAAVGNVNIFCDTTSRRFFAGGRIVICDATSTTVCTSFEFATISAVAPTFITVSAGLTQAHGVGSRLFPVMEADLVPSMSAGIITDDKASLSMTFRETVGASTLDPITAAGSDPAGYSTFPYIYGQDDDGNNLTTDLPVVSIDADWSGANGAVQVGAARNVETSQVGLMNITEAHGSRFKASIALPALGLDRATIFTLAGLFDSRGGRRNAFIAINPTNDYTLYQTPKAGDTRITVVLTGSVLDFSWVGLICVTLADGTQYLYQPTNSGSNGLGGYFFELGQQLPTYPSPIMRISNAYLMRFDSDSLQEQWVTDQAASMQFTMVELLAEDSLLTPCTDSAPQPTGGGVAAGGGGFYSYMPRTIYVQVQRSDTGTTHTATLVWDNALGSWNDPATNSDLQKSDSISDLTGATIDIECVVPGDPSHTFIWHSTGLDPIALIPLTLGDWGVPPTCSGTPMPDTVMTQYTIVDWMEVPS